MSDRLQIHNDNLMFLGETIWIILKEIEDMNRNWLLLIQFKRCFQPEITSSGTVSQVRNCY